MLQHSGLTLRAYWPAVALVEDMVDAEEEG